MTANQTGNIDFVVMRGCVTAISQARGLVLSKKACVGSGMLTEANRQIVMISIPRSMCKEEERAAKRDSMTIRRTQASPSPAANLTRLFEFFPSSSSRLMNFLRLSASDCSS